MKSKIVNAVTNKENGYSCVTVQNKYGKFFGHSLCHPNDMESFSPFVGERYAEIRAHASFAKFRYKQEKIKKKTVENLIKDIEHFCTEEDKKNNPVYRRMKLALRDYSNSTENWEILYKYLEKDSISEQDKIRKDILSRTNRIK